MNRGLAEVDAERRMDKFVTKLVEAVDEELEALDLDLRAGEAVENDAVAVFGPEQFAQENADDFAIADHAAGVFDAFRLGGIEQRADDDWRAGESAGF